MSRPTFKVIIPLDGPDYETLVWTVPWSLDEEHVLRFARAMRREYGNGVHVLRETTVEEEIEI